MITLTTGLYLQFVVDTVVFVFVVVIAVVGFLEFFVSFVVAFRFFAVIYVDARAASVVVVIVVTVILILIVAAAFLSAVLAIEDVFAKVDIFIYSYICQTQSKFSML